MRGEAGSREPDADRIGYPRPARSTAWWNASINASTRQRRTPERAPLPRSCCPDPRGSPRAQQRRSKA